MKQNKLTFYHQLTSTDCGAACLAMIASFFGKRYSLYQLKSLFEFTRIGITIQDIADKSAEIGFDAKILKLTTEELQTFPFPVILYWNQEHFLVYEKTSAKKAGNTFHLSDPAYGRVMLQKEDFEKAWKGNNDKGIAIVLQPNENFEEKQPANNVKKPLMFLPIYTQIKSFLTTINSVIYSPFC